jgi:hypothetical protein
MARYTGTVASNKTPDEVFDYMAMFSNVTEWDPTAEEAHPIEGNAPGPGAKFFVRVKMLGREIPLEYVTTAYERPHRLVMRAENDSSISEDTVTVRATPTGAEMTYDAQVTFKNPLRYIDPLFNLFFKRVGDNAAAGLRRELNRA